MVGRSLKPVRANAKRRALDDVESAVLAYVAAERPEGITITLLALHFNDEFDQGIGGLAIERAVRELVCDGLLQMQGARVALGAPGRAAASNPTRSQAVTPLEQRESFSFDWAALVPLLVHPMQVEIIESLHRVGQPLSATDLRKIFEGRVLSQTVAYHLGVLDKVGVISLVRQRQVRGATEKFYFLAEFQASDPVEPLTLEAAESATRPMPALLVSAGPKGTKARGLAPR